MTPITEAHRAEARRRLEPFIINEYIAKILAQALAEPAWQPPVDPDLIEARECAALACEANGWLVAAAYYRTGERDKSATVQSAFIAIKRSKGQ